MADQSTSLLQIDNNKVGIGIARPEQKLHIYGSDASFLLEDGSGASLLSVKGAGNGYINAGISLQATAGSHDRGMGIFMHDAGADTEWFAGTPYANGDQYQIGRRSSIAAHSNDTAQIGYALMTIRNDGKVGLGTTIPTAGMEVKVTSGLNLTLTKSTGAYLSFNDTSNNRGHITANYSGGAHRDGVILGGGSGLGNLMVVSGSALTNARVGIGTLNPSSTLHVNGGGIVVQGANDTSPVQALLLKTSAASSQGYLAVEGNSAGAFITGTLANATVLASSASNTALQLGASGTVKMTILGTANGTNYVGIGTTAPVTSGQRTSLHLYGNHSSQNTVLKIEQDGASSSALIQIDSAADRDSGIYFMENGNNKARIINDASANALVLSDGDFTNTLYVYGGKVGVGTIAPTSTLDVRAESAAYLTVRSDDSNAILQIMADNDSTHTGNFNPSIRMYTGNSTKYWQIYGNDATTEFKIDYNSSNGFKMDASRNVTIPQNLTVGGTITANQLNVETVTKTVLYSSGSTKFGDSNDDTHSMTGSLMVRQTGVAGPGPVSVAYFDNTLNVAGSGSRVNIGYQRGQYSVAIGSVNSNSSPAYLNPNMVFYTMHNAYQESDLTERMRLTSTGRLLINTTTDAGHHLSVNGTVKSAGALTIGSEVLNTNFSSSLAGRVATLQAASSGFSVTNSSNNRILTSVNSTTGRAESNLTFDGSTLNVYGNIQSDSSGKYLSIGESWSPAGTYGVAKFHGAHNTGGTRVMFSNANSSTRYGIVMHGSDTGTADKLGIGLLMAANGTYTDAVPAITIDSSKRVGIGTTSPESILHIRHSSSDIDNSKALRIENTAGSAGDYALLQFSVSDANSGKAGIGMVRHSAYGLGDIVFLVDSNSDHNDLVEGDEKMRITNQGHVGIGTTSPNQKLSLAHINSGANYIHFTNSTTAYGATDGILIGMNAGEEFNLWNYEATNMNLAIANGVAMTIQWISGAYRWVGIGGGHTPDSPLHVKGGTANTAIFQSDSGATNITFENSSGALVGQLEFVDGAGISQLVTRNASSLRLGTNNTNGLTISGSNQNVGIGVLDPDQKLEVKGDGARINISSLDHTVVKIGGYGSSSGNEDIGFLGLFSGNTQTVRIGAHASAPTYFTNPVGIGTQTPRRQLHVYKAELTKPVAVFQNSSGNGYFGIALGYDPANNDYLNTWGSQYSSGANVIGYAVKPSHTANDVFLSAADNSGFGKGALVIDNEMRYYNAGGSVVAVDTAVTMYERFTVRHDGKVGIGDASPSEKLDVSGGHINIDNNYAYKIGGNRFLLYNGTDTFLGDVDGAGGSVYIREDGSTKIAITGGKVGIGTTTIQSKLHIESGGAGNAYGSCLYLHGDTATNYPAMKIDNATGGNANETHGLLINNTAAGAGLRVDSPAMSPFIIKATGRVGIGTDDPTSVLHLKEVNNPPVIFVEDSRTSLGDNVQTAGIHFKSNDSTSGGTGVHTQIITETEASTLGRSHSLFFQTSGDASGTSLTRLAITSTGRVGIGQTTPDGTLHIQSGHAGSVVAGTSADDLIVENSGDAGISVISPDANSSRIQFGSPSDNDIGHLGGFYNSGNEYLFFNVGGSERVVIRGTGKVGIGTNNPQKMLEVIVGENNFASFATQFSPGSRGGIHFGYRENNNAYRHSQLMFQRTDRFANNAMGRIMLINKTGTDSANPGISDAHLIIDELGFVGIGRQVGGHYSTGTRIQALLHVSASANVVGSTTASLYVEGSGSEVVAVDGTLGRLFSVSDNFSGSLFSANTISGTPVIEAFSDNSVHLGPFSNPIQVSSLGHISGSSISTASFGRLQVSTIAGNSPLSIDSSLRLGGGGMSDVYPNNLVITSNAPAIFLDDSDVSNLRHSIVGGGNAGLEIQADIHNQATGYISFAVGGNPVARFVEGGNVGIGNTSPQHKLDVYGTDDVTMRIHRPSSGLGANDTCGIGFSHRSDTSISTSDVRAGIFSTYNGEMFLATEAGGNLNSNPNDHARLYIDGAGLVGIGTNNPAYTLAVEKSVTGDWLSRIYNTATTTNPSGLLVRVDDADSTGILFGANASGTYRFVVKPDGNVGIGTTTPSDKLHVYRHSTNYFIVANQSQLRANTSGIGFEVANSDSTGTALRIGTSTSKPSFLAKGGDGFVGIGTNNPGYPLHVYSLGTGLKVEAAGQSPFTQKIAEFKYIGNGGSLFIENIAGRPAININGNGLILGTGGYNRLEINTQGNIIIAHTAPAGMANSSYKQIALNNGAVIADSGGTNSAFMLLQNSYVGASNNNYYTVGSKASRIMMTTGDISFATAGAGSADGQITWQTRMYIEESNGHVGIGTTSPGYQLELQKASGGFINIKTTDTEIVNGDVLGTIQFSADDATASGLDIGAQIRAVATDNFQTAASNVDAPTRLEFITETNVATNTMSTPTMVVGGDEKFVGIGITTPQATLDISTTSGVIIRDHASAGGGGMNIFYTTADGYYNMFAGMNSTNNFNIGSAGTDNTPIGNTKVNHFTVTGAGNVGIGASTSPANKLHITTNVGNDNYSPTGDNYANAILQLQNTSTSATTPHSLIHFRLDKNGGDGYLGFTTDGSTGNVEHFVLGNQVDNEILRVASGGKVGIGTTGPSQKLHVHGGHILLTGGPSDGAANGEVRFTYISESSYGVAAKIAGLRTDADQAKGGALAFYTQADNTSDGGTERMRIDANGNVGIGGAPVSGIKLDVIGGHLAIDSGYSLFFDGGSDTRMLESSANVLDWVVGGTTSLRLEPDGDLQVRSDVVAFSSIYSDERLKDNVKTIDSALEKVKKLRGVEYVWNSTSRKGQKDIGVIAQETEKVLPEIVREKKMGLHTDSDKKFKTVDYEKLAAVLIESVKEQQKQIEELRSEIQELKDGSSK